MKITKTLENRYYYHPLTNKRVESFGYGYRGITIKIDQKDEIICSKVMSKMYRMLDIEGLDYEVWSGLEDNGVGNEFVININSDYIKEFNQLYKEFKKECKKIGGKTK